MFKYYNSLKKLYYIIHHNILLLVIGSYILATITPETGSWIKNYSYGSIKFHYHAINFTLPAIMLAILLFNAGLSIKLHDLRSISEFKKVLFVGIIGNTIIPLIYLILLSFICRYLNDQTKAQDILVGVAIVASMPIAGSSTAWSKTSDGNLALSLGLVLLTTVISPLVTPVTLHTVGYQIYGAYSEELHNLAGGTVISFLIAWVIIPSIFGVIIRIFINQILYLLIDPYLNLINIGMLILIIYSNASVYLPELITNPDIQFILCALLATSILCALMFFAGFQISRLFSLPRSETASLSFGLGMNNNGSSLVLASTGLYSHPRVMLPIILYILMQHICAAYMHKLISTMKSQY
jgi:BASS family bile acid:Na+ symporter